MLQDAVGICRGLGNQRAGHFHRGLGIFLRFTQSGEFGFILGSSISSTEVGVVVESDSHQRDFMGEAHRE